MLAHVVWTLNRCMSDGHSDTTNSEHKPLSKFNSLWTRSDMRNMRGQNLTLDTELCRQTAVFVFGICGSARGQ